MRGNPLYFIDKPVIDPSALWASGINNAVITQYFYAGTLQNQIDGEGGTLAVQFFSPPKDIYLVTVEREQGFRASFAELHVSTPV